MPFAKRRNKTHLSNNRKWSHWRFKHKDNYTIQSPQSLPCEISSDLLSICNLFPGRNAPSIYAYTQIFKLLKQEDHFSEWQQIKHNDLSLTLCTFRVNKSATPVVEKTLIINTDLTWKIVICNNIPIALDHEDVPEKVSHYTSFVRLISAAENINICLGIDDTKFSELIKDREAGTFVDRSGNTTAIIENDINNIQIIRHIKCTNIAPKGQNICNVCKSFRCNLNKILWKKTNCSNDNSNAVPKTHPSSHCPWKYLSEEEKRKRIEGNSQEIQRTAGKNNKEIAE